MKKIILAALLSSLFVFSSAFAEVLTVETKINQMFESESSRGFVIVYSENDGRVYRVNSGNTELLDVLRDSLENNTWIKLTVDEKKLISAVKFKKKGGQTLFETYEKENRYFSPTTISASKASQIFAGLNKKAKSKSQCYKRAHVWAFNMKQKHNVDSMKIFLFFTKKYIEEFEYDWWFHVAPYVATTSGELVMDRTYTRSPMSVPRWTSIFMKNNASCPVVNSYNQYSQNQWSNYCYVRKVSMYYFQPLDISRADNGGYGKDYWQKWELKSAKKEFHGWWHSSPIDYSETF